MPDYSFTRLDGKKKFRTDKLTEVMKIKDLAQERWLVVSPHDDDACMGGAMWISAAVKAGIDVQVLIVTDGRMGYCTLKERATIVKVRRRETYDSFAMLGIPKERVCYMGFADGALYQSQGRHKALRRESMPVIEGYTGLLNSFVWHLRRFRPTAVLVPTPTDLHPDHQITHNELMISLFHASGAIWPELGRSLVEVPRVYELAIYCDFSLPPNLEIKASPQAFQQKLDSIAAYKSQAQIAQLVENVRDAGPVEYLRDVKFRFYKAQYYRSMFA